MPYVCVLGHTDRNATGLCPDRSITIASFGDFGTRPIPCGLCRHHQSTEKNAPTKVDWMWFRGHKRLHMWDDCKGSHEVEERYGLRWQTNFSEPDFSSTLNKYAEEYGVENVFILNAAWNTNEAARPWTTPGYGLYITKRIHRRMNMAINNGKPGEFIRVVNPKNPFHGEIVEIIDPLRANERRTSIKNPDGVPRDDAFRVYKCRTVKTGTLCLISPSECERASVPGGLAQGLTPLGKVRLASSNFVGEAISLGLPKDVHAPSGDQWEALSVITNRDGKFAGIRIGCTYLDADGVNEILDRLGEVGYPLASADAMERVKDD